ncbi:hypothetical protein BHM03_00014009 [Ensete ventricosum]|nr:hypothetical protein BHM03_00014009 [Ensete ventricosum]
MAFTHSLLSLSQPSPCAATAAAADAWRPTVPTRRLASTVYSPSSSPFPRAEPAIAVATLRRSKSKGGFKEFGLMERLGEGKMPTAVIGEIADDLNLDLVVLSMEAIHSKSIRVSVPAEVLTKL